MRLALLGCTITTAALVLFGCGGEDDTSTAVDSESSSAIEAANDEVVAEAEQSATTEEELQTEVLRRLKQAGVELYADSVNKWNFDVQSGTCFLDSVFSAAEGPRPTVDYEELYDPAGRGGVVIGKFQGTQDADCLATVQDALGW